MEVHIRCAMQIIFHVNSIILNITDHLVFKLALAVDTSFLAVVNVAAVAPSTCWSSMEKMLLIVKMYVCLCLPSWLFKRTTHP